MNPKPGRPVGVTLLAIVFLWIGGWGTLLFPLFLLFPGGLNPGWKLALGPMIHRPTLLTAVSWFLTAGWYLAYVAYLFIGVGLLKLRNWARIGVLVISGLGVFLGVIATAVLARYHPAIPVLIGLPAAMPFAWIGWYCMRPGVRFAFGAWPVKLDENSSPIPPPRLSTRDRILVGIFAGATTVGLFVVSLLITVSTVMRSSEAYRMAMNAAQPSPCVSNALGTPLTAGWWMTGSVETQGAKGSAELSIPVHGPKGKGDLNVEAKKQDGVWKIVSLDLEDKRGRTPIIPAPSGAPCQVINPAFH